MHFNDKIKQRICVQISAEEIAIKAFLPNNQYCCRKELNVRINFSIVESQYITMFYFVMFIIFICLKLCIKLGTMGSCLLYSSFLLAFKSSEATLKFKCPSAIRQKSFWGKVMVLVTVKIDRQLFFVWIFSKTMSIQNIIHLVCRSVGNALTDINAKIWFTPIFLC